MGLLGDLVLCHRCCWLSVFCPGRVNVRPRSRVGVEVCACEIPVIPRSRDICQSAAGFHSWRGSLLRSPVLTTRCPCRQRRVRIAPRSKAAMLGRKYQKHLHRSCAGPGAAAAAVSPEPPLPVTYAPFLAELCRFTPSAGACLRVFSEELYSDCSP